MKEVAPPLPDRVNRRIESSTVYRDYRLICQSGAVVVYYTTNVYSHGVASEINYADANSKLVVIIWPHSQSPFLKNQADKIVPHARRFPERRGKRVSRKQGVTGRAHSRPAIVQAAASVADGPAGPLVKRLETRGR